MTQSLCAKLKALFCGGKPGVLETLAQNEVQYRTLNFCPAGRPYLVARLNIPVPAGRGELDTLLRKHGWEALESRFGTDLRTAGLFRREALAGLLEQTRIAQERKPDFAPLKFDRYVRIDPVPALRLQQLQELAEALQAQPLANLFEPGAYVHRPAPPPAVNWQDDPKSSEQLHLNGGGVGINAKTAWGFAGADGKTTPTKGPAPKFRNVDCGWRFPQTAPPFGPIDHEDLAAVQLNPKPVANYGVMRDHGTAMLGIVLARDNTVGGVGIVPNLSEVGLVYYDPDYDPEYPPDPLGPDDLPNAIGRAMAGLQAGDVILLEVQVYAPGSYMLAPPEIYPVERGAIDVATTAGIIVIEPCGNGTNNGPPVLKADADLLPGNSGAILVTAAAAWPPHYRLPYTAFGQRIDCYAWGASVLTSGGRLRDEYVLASGTSAASAMIAGVALAVQCAYIEKRTSGPARLDGPAMRQLLRNPAYGTPAPPPPPGHGAIGSMPDLDKIIKTF